MTRIFISYGITKSASTFTWQLIKRTAISGGLPIATLTPKSKGADTPEDYIDELYDKNFDLIKEDVGDLPVVIKTHGDATLAVARLVAEGTVQVFASYRDLRDVALSLLDHGARSRAEGIEDFSDFCKPTDTLEHIKVQVQSFENWVQSCNPLLLSYDEICFDTRSTISKISERLGVSIDVDLVFDEFNINKASIGQFNKGKRRRFEREMDAKTSAFFLNVFAPYYRIYFPDEMPTTKYVTTNFFTREIREQRQEMTLSELADRFKSDKGTQVGTPPHRYTYLYDLLFWPLKEEAICFLEIGLAAGGPEVGGSIERMVVSPSTQMWLSYFPRAHIYGFDISDFSHMEDSRFTFIRGDAGSEADLRRLSDTAPGFDVIIDDASHASYHQQLAFNVLFPKLAPGGIYIIEDLHWQSPAYESALPQVPKTAVFFQSFFENGVYVKNSLLTEGCIGRIKAQIASFAAFGAFDGSAKSTKLIVIRKASGKNSGETAIPQPVRSTSGPAKALTGNSTATVSADEFIAAAYAAVLERRPDPGAFQAYRKAFQDASPRLGLERTLKALLRSDEFQNKQVLKALDRVRQSKNNTPEDKTNVLFIQTADPNKYHKLLNLTSKTVAEYCKRNKFDYQSYVGIIRGYYPWQATFNRIPMLYRLAEGGFSGWACYLDADAFVADLNFDLIGYFADKADTALIAAPGGESFWWAVNAGVLFLNLGHPLGQAIVREWHTAFSAITDDKLRVGVGWSSVPDDQSLLHQVLRTMPYVENHIGIDRACPPLMNYEGRFIKQVLRVAGSLEEREDRLRAEVSRVLGHI